MPAEVSGPQRASLRDAPRVWTPPGGVTSEACARHLPVPRDGTFKRMTTPVEVSVPAGIASREDSTLRTSAPHPAPPRTTRKGAGAVADARFDDSEPRVRTWHRH
jgi:hypothetical protein